MVYQNLNRITINQQALLANHRALQRFRPEAQICPVLKSNAYGHGLKAVAPVFDKMNCAFLVVDSLFEAYELYKLRVKTPILIMGYTQPVNFTVKRLPFELAVFDLELAKLLNKYQPHCKIHLFVNTGMNREGINLKDLPYFLVELKKLDKLQVVGLCSHLADADNPQSSKFVNYQLAQYKKALQILNDYGFNPQWRHIAASGGAFKIKDQTFNMIRAGLASYGLNPLEKKDASVQQIHLKPALEFSSTLAQIRTITKGEVVGYGCTFKVKKTMVLGLLPVGYYDGVDRRLSNVGVVKIRGQYCPIVGRVSMNMTVVDISKLFRPRLGEKVIIYSVKITDKNNLSQAAAQINTISYELLVHLAESIKRIVI